MKKLFSLLIIMSFTAYSFSQAEPVLRSKKGIYILPQTGDIGVGVNANPIFSYIGTMFTQNNAMPGLNFQTLNFKQFTEQNTARRAGLTIASNVRTDILPVASLDPDDEPGTLVNDKKTISEFNILLNLGIEKRRGSGRLQGIYGIDGLLGFGTGNREKIKYANSMEFHYAAWGTSRPTMVVNTPPNFSIGAQAFIGFEYFFAPKMSIGGEAYLRAVYNIGFKSINKTEQWDPSEGVSNITETSLTNRYGDFDFGTFNWSSLRIMFYF